jgi:hypothetical protein
MEEDSVRCRRGRHYTPHTLHTDAEPGVAAESMVVVRSLVGNEIRKNGLSETTLSILSFLAPLIWPEDVHHHL